MAIDKLVKPAIVVVLLGAIVLMGLAVMGQFSKTLRLSTTATIEDLTMPAQNSSSLVGASGTYPFLQSMTGCANSSNAVALTLNTDYSISEGGSTGGTITNLNADYSGHGINCTITFLEDTTAQASADTFITGIAYFGTFAGVIILAYIGRIIIGIFRRKDE